MGMSVLPSGKIDDESTDDEVASSDETIDTPGGISLVAVTRKVSSTFSTSTSAILAT